MSEQTHQLTVRRGPKQGHVYELLLPIVNVGRDPMSDINLNDPEVSRQHARFIRTHTGYQLQDLNSTNGTYLNGKKLEGDAVPLQPGQEVMMGSGVVLLYQVIIEEDPLLAVEEPHPAVPEDEFDEGDMLEGDYRETIQSHFRPPLSPPKTADPTPVHSSASPPPLPNWRNQPNAESARRQTAHLSPPKEPVSSQVIMPPENSNRRNITMIVAVSAVLLCLCCTFLVFMYYWGGDWLLQQLGLIN